MKAPTLLSPTHSAPLVRRALLATVATAVALAALPSGNALAGTREQAMRIHDRLNGAPPTQTVLDTMQAQIVAGNSTGAAMTAIADPNGLFYSVVLKNFVTP